MTAQHQAVRAPAGGRAVGRGGLGDELGEAGAEALDVGGSSEADLRLDRERQQPGPLAAGCGLHADDVPDDVGRGADQVLRRVAVLRLDPGDGAEDGGIDDERVGAGGEDALGEAAAGALLDELEQSRLLERPQVVVDPLAAEAELRCELGGGRGLAQPLQ
jgi:hypothetical protein